MYGHAVALLACCVARSLGTPVLRSASPADPSAALPPRPALQACECVRHVQPLLHRSLGSRPVRTSGW